MRNLGGGIGISIAITILERRTQFHLDRLSSHLSLFDTPFQMRLNTMIHTFVAQGYTTAEATTRALAAIYNTVSQQAEMLAYVDVFKLGAIGCLAVVSLVALLRKIDIHAKHAPVGH
jgi:MFS transporter, DHA2 family, multidrug resistance protein